MTEKVKTVIEFCFLLPDFKYRGQSSQGSAAFDIKNIIESRQSGMNNSGYPLKSMDHFYDPHLNNLLIITLGLFFCGVTTGLV